MVLVNIYKQVLIAMLFLVWQEQATAQVWTLEQCLDTALHGNGSLRVSKSNLDLSTLKKEELQAAKLPKVVANGDYKYFTNLPYQLLPLSVFNGAEGVFKEAQFGVPHNIGINVQAAFPVYNPQLATAVEIAEVGEKMSVLQHLKVEEAVFFELSNGYYNVQLLQQQLAFLDSNLRNVRRLLDNLTLLNAQGLAKGTDVSKVALQEGQLQTQQAVLSSNLQQVKQGLLWLMGLPLDTPFEAEDIFLEEAEAAVYVGNSSVDWKMAQTRREILQLERERLMQSKLPTVSVMANYGLTGFGYGREPSPFLKFFPIGFVGVQANYTIWDATTARKVAQKDVELRQNMAQLSMLETQTEMQVSNALLKRSGMLQPIKQILRQIELAQNIYNQTILQQQQGVATLADVLLADNALREGQQAYLAAVVDYFRADLELRKAVSKLRG